MTHQPYASYLVRFWREDSGGELEERWRGEVESVQTGQKWQFCDLHDMLQFFQAQMEAQSMNISEQDGG